MIRAIDPLVSLPATDPDRAVRFYTETLGLELVMHDAPSGFAIFRAPGAEVPLVGVHRHDGPIAPPEAQGLWCWLHVEELGAARERLEAAGVRIVGEPFSLGPGVHLPFLDSEGNVLHLWEPIQEVRRSVEIARPPAEVFRALVEPDMIERWFATIDDVRVEAREGGAISFIDPLFGRVRGRVTAWEPHTRLAFTFDENWPAHLEYTLAELPGGGTRLEVRQHGFDAIRDRDFGIPGLIEHLDAALALLRQALERAVHGVPAADVPGDALRAGQRDPEHAG